LKNAGELFYIPLLGCARRAISSPGNRGEQIIACLPIFSRKGLGKGSAFVLTGINIDGFNVVVHNSNTCVHLCLPTVPAFQAFEKQAHLAYMQFCTARYRYNYKYYN
jgi:hypothetical protein